MIPVTEPTWSSSAAALLGRDAVPAAQATGSLLERAEERWKGRVVPRTSMHDLLFTVPGDCYPFVDTVRVAWEGGVYRFTLSVERGKVLAQDACGEPKADAVLDAFLVQLVGED